MITEIPTAKDFHEAGVNQLYLAWQIAIRAIQDHEEAKGLNFDMEQNEADEAAVLYWQKAQPVLANAFGLVQQSMEMALKGRIAALSPYLLIARDPKDWPGSVDKRPVPFSEFRSLDAADLVKVHNAFADNPLDDNFKVFWDQVRRDRNKLIHSVRSINFEPNTIVRTIFIAIESLFSDVYWPERLIQMASEETYTAYLDSDMDRNIVMEQIAVAVSSMSPADNKRFLGFDNRRRTYTCPECWQTANREWQEHFPALAQLLSKQQGETSLSCIVCRGRFDVERKGCNNAQCEGDVIRDGVCLTCLWEQDSPYDFSSGLRSENHQLSHEYRFSFREDGRNSIDTGRFESRDLAIEHARLALSAAYLKNWQSVSVSKGYNDNSLIGIWQRAAESLIWHSASEISEQERNQWLFGMR